MKKWADYLISEVNYDSEHLISIAIRHEDTDKGITVGIPVDRLRISSDIKNGLSYTTIYHGKNSWKKGKAIQTFFIDGTPYLRIDENQVNLDYLGDLPNSSIVIEELPQELEPFPEPEPAVEPAPSSKGSLPKESAEELPQELELLPEPAVEPAPSSKGSLPKGFTAKPPQTSPTNVEQKSKKQELEDYENDYMKRMEQQRIDDEKAYQELVAAEEIDKSQQVRGSLPKGFESLPEPAVEPAPSSKGSLPKESAEELPQELELLPEPAVEPAPSSKGSLPKESAEELPQELELLPEPAVEPAPSSKGSLPKESAEELPQELELLPEPAVEPAPSSKGSLPKGFTAKPPQELESPPEPAVETQVEEVTSEQLSQVNNLEQQIDELEDLLSAQALPEPDDEVTPEQLSQVNDLEQQIDELEDILFSQLDPTSEGTLEQLSKIKELENEIKKLETVDLEHEIIQTLQNQNKKLDNIEKKLQNPTTKKSTTKKSTTKKSTTKKSTTSDSLEAYCVKCKTKREIKNPTATVMKNGRDAVKGTCSICDCNVFRIGKMKK